LRDRGGQHAAGPRRPGHGPALLQRLRPARVRERERPRARPALHGRQLRGQFWDYHELMREIRNSYNPATAITEYELLEPVIELEVLLLDDLGAWKMTDWMNDTLFY